MFCICGVALRTGPVSKEGARESLACPNCGCTSRQRAVGWAVRGRARDAMIYQVGQDNLSPLLKRWCAKLVISELVERPGCVQQNIEKLTFEDNLFDIVICSDVLEHVRDYERALSELVRVTRKGGVIAITVPAAPQRNQHFLYYLRGPTPDKDVWAANTPVHHDPLNPEGCRVYRHFGYDALCCELMALNCRAWLEFDRDCPTLGIVNSTVIMAEKLGCE